MRQFTRRDALKAIGAGTLVGATGGLALPARAADLRYIPEKGAALRLLRWKRFVQGDEDQWLANTQRFTKATGVNVRVDSENFEDIRPKAAVAASVGSGPDIVLGWYDDPHQYADKLIDLRFDVTPSHGIWFLTKLLWFRVATAWGIAVRARAAVDDDADLRPRDGRAAPPASPPSPASKPTRAPSSAPSGSSAPAGGSGR